VKTIALVLVALVFGLLLGCGSSVVQLSREELDRLPRDSRMEIFDAENDLVIARNRRDEADDKRLAVERSLDELDARWGQTEKRLGGSAKVGQARKVFDANRAYLVSLRDVIDADIEATRLDVELSRKRLVLVRQRQAARIGRATLGSLKPLETDVADAEAKAKAASATENNLRARAQSLLDVWKGAEDEYARATGDYDTGVWQ
jgi:hypothetical protein